MAGIELFSYADAYPSGPVDRLYRELAEQAVLADELGYRRLWLTEQHLSAPGRVPDSLQMLAFLAAKTSRLRLGTGVLPAAVHHPVLLLESALQLDAVSGGRLDLGIGSGSEAGPILDVLGLRPEEAAERTARLYDLIAATQPGAPLPYPAERGDSGLILDPAPARPLLGQVWTAAGRSALALATRHGTGLLLPRPMPLAARRELAAAYRASVPDGRIVHFKAGLVARTTSEARRRAAGFVQDYARRYLDRSVGGPDTADFAAAIDALDFAVGAPDEVADRIRAWLDPFDEGDGIAIQFAGPRVQQQHVLESLELLAPPVVGRPSQPRAGGEGS
jgi:alkanesulfonate monooxygenase SsuD/methylene tetrahydromethanopterin reductase-like flavin-dependent oxidoreductase (luciferase family)